MDFRFDEGHSPHHINADLYDDVSDDTGVMRWVAIAILVFVLSAAIFAALVVFCWSK